LHQNGAAVVQIADSGSRIHPTPHSQHVTPLDKAFALKFGTRLPINQPAVHIP
jgi:hypothetical protein